MYMHGRRATAVAISAHETRVPCDLCLYLPTESAVVYILSTRGRRRNETTSFKKEQLHGGEGNVCVCARLCRLDRRETVPSLPTNPRTSAGEGARRKTNCTFPLALVISSPSWQRCSLTALEAISIWLI
ncbi:hypothetical protein CoHVHLJ_126 [Columbid alphaherpesvirus 1]|uniref:Uncharacterized protein n=1 Tax=Columbid alphaherpesvirus 1 TaxID=93386 RepID=A0A1V0M8M7_9ALPH|nr:hypothetical protein CoHVHLJ_090 [Columbid alphaherpesvirus 1]YP_009353020.1 hypothetical protein CoHVHLJ_126 [Columbid alphaherpesvirus 1]ARD71401.1 hypothetical protein CoHVHLJ_090 [Columbid alphaherpesvirus 1]ARD71437.1 hypothetical protein CoHVHLJ_126 [Columbid alphaherpesvirus 1]